MHIILQTRRVGVVRRVPTTVRNCASATTKCSAFDKTTNGLSRKFCWPSQLCRTARITTSFLAGIRRSAKDFRDTAMQAHNTNVHQSKDTSLQRIAINRFGTSCCPTFRGSALPSVSTSPPSTTTKGRRATTTHSSTNDSAFLTPKCHMNTPRSLRILFGSWSLGMCISILAFWLSFALTRSVDWLGLN